MASVTHVVNSGGVKLATWQASELYIDLALRCAACGKQLDGTAEGAGAEWTVRVERCGCEQRAAAVLLAAQASGDKR